MQDDVRILQRPQGLDRAAVPDPRGRLRPASPRPPRRGLDARASNCRAIASAPRRSPAMNRRAAGPSMRVSKNRRRSWVFAQPLLLAVRRPRSQIANSPNRLGMNASRRSRSRRARTGEVPPVETATSTGSRSTMAGTMKREASRSSTTLTGMAAASLKLAIQRLTARREVATMTSRTPSRSAGSNSRATICNRPAAARSASSGTSSRRHHRDQRGGTLAAETTLRKATSPPPTTSTRLALADRRKPESTSPHPRIAL